MSFKTWWRGFRYSPYDSRGNARCLLGRETDPTQSDVEGVPPEVRDAALKAICKSFEIPERQMYCLRATDELMTIYRDMNGPRTFDQLQFERLGFEIEDLVGSQLSVSEILNIKTVADVIHAAAQRRGKTDLHDAQPASRKSAPLEYATVSSPRFGHYQIIFGATAFICDTLFIFAWTMRTGSNSLSAKSSARLTIMLATIIVGTALAITGIVWITISGRARKSPIVIAATTFQLPLAFLSMELIMAQF
jgi:hypothetical protein